MPRSPSSIGTPFLNQRQIKTIHGNNGSASLSLLSLSILSGRQRKRESLLFTGQLSSNQSRAVSAQYKRFFLSLSKRICGNSAVWVPSLACMKVEWGFKCTTEESSTQIISQDGFRCDQMDLAFSTTLLPSSYYTPLPRNSKPSCLVAVRSKMNMK